jgi:RNA polymerase sigma-70 factor (ECF subfamily)
MNDNKDDKILKEIYAAYYRTVFNYAKKRMNEADAEDVVQNVFLKLTESTDWLQRIISVSDKPEKVRSILFIFVRNGCNNFYRLAKNTGKIFADVPGLENVAAVNPEQEYQNNDMISLLMARAGKLSRQNKNIFIKYYIEGYSVMELAGETGLSSHAVEGRLYRILKFLRKKMSKEKI